MRVAENSVLTVWSSPEILLEQFALLACSRNSDNINLFVTKLHIVWYF